jgi:hypothetical protein
MVYLLKMVLFHGYVSHNQMVYVFYTSRNSMYKFGPTMDAPHPCPMPQVLARMNGAVEK